MKALPTNSRGSIAVLALWVLVLLAFLAVGLAQGTRQKILVAQHLRARQELRWAQEGVLKKVISNIQSAPMALSQIATGKEWYSSLLEKPMNLSTGNAQAHFKIEDENTKINLNKASSYVLANLFQYAARLTREKAERLADEIHDFRDEDDYVTGDGKDGGSEKGAYKQAGLTWGPKNADFEFPEELLRVKGITKEIYSFVENYITIYGDGRVNVNTCKKEMLYALGLESSLVDKVLAVRDGAPGISAGLVYPDVTKIEKIVLNYYSLSAVEEESLRHAILQNELCVVSGAFRISGNVLIEPSNLSSRFACVYVQRGGVRYYVET